MSNIKCKNCGADIPANMKFCGTCGTPAEPAVAVEAEAAPTGTLDTDKTTHSKLKKFIMPVVAVAAVIIVACIAFNILKSSNYVEKKSYIYIMQDEDSVVIEPNGKGKIMLEGSLINENHSLDGSKAAILINENDNDNGSNGEGYSLYHVTDKATFVTDGVYDMRMSLSGDGIVFTKEQDNSDYTAELCLWAGGKVRTITTEFSTRNGFNISPDGKIVTYTLYDEDKLEVEGYYFDGKNTSLGKDVVPVAISNGAKYVYYIKKDSFYVQKGANRDSKNKLGENIYRYIFNTDLSQIVYNYNEKSYISCNGGEKNSLTGSMSNFLTPDGTVADYYVIGVSSFADTYYYTTSSNIVHINGKFETNNVVKNVNNPQLMNDGKTIIYQKSDRVHKIDGTKENAKDIELVEKDVVNFIAVSDGSAIYFINDDDELFYQKGKGKPVKVGEDLSGSSLYGDYWTMYKGSKLFYISDEELCWSTGGKGKVVTDINGDVEYVFANTDYVMVGSADHDEYLRYLSKDGNKFEQYNTN